MNHARRAIRSYSAGARPALLAYVAVFSLGTAPHLIAAGTSVAAGTPPKQWASFSGNAGFSVQYPVAWVRKDIAIGRLLILSSEGGAGEAMIRPGQALLSVVEAQKDENLSLQQLSDRYNQGIAILVRRHIHNVAAGADGCRDLYEVVSKEPAAPPGESIRPGPELINTEFFCQIARKKYVTVLRNFEGDEQQARYQEVALRVVESLRVRRAATSSAVP
jgi:hypothetical protein